MQVSHALFGLAFLVFADIARAHDPEIILTEIDAARWRVEYRLDAPAMFLRFSRAQRAFRQDHWRPTDRAFKLTQTPAGEGVRRKDGRSFQRVQFDIDVQGLGLRSNYEPFVRFSDGGVLAYTGYYFACADGPCTTSSAWRIRVEPVRRRRATRGPSASSRQASFVDRGDGSQVYVGAARVEQKRRYAAVFDPALRPDTRRVIGAFLPKIMNVYARRLGALPHKPAFFVSLGVAADDDGSETRGSALPNQVSIHFAGKRWVDERSVVEPGFLPWYFAHEAAHLHQRIEDRPNADNFMAEGWIHEGGAEALAAIAVAAIDPGLKPYVDARIAAAAKDCDYGLRSLGAPLNASLDRGAADNYYVCGLAMQMAIDRDVRAASGGERDLFDVWRAFLDATANGASWNETNFLRAARAAGARDDTLRLVSTLARKRTKWAQDALKERLLAAPPD